MRLHNRTIAELAEMICGEGGGSGGGYARPHFLYRSSSQLTAFFEACDLDYAHDGTTRRFWVEGVLAELNSLPATSPQLPSGALVRVIQELLDPADFRDDTRTAALAELNSSLSRDGLEAYLEGAGRCHVRNTGSLATSAAGAPPRRAWTPQERARRAELAAYLDSASEDEVTERVLLPLFQQLGFLRITAAGHKDKALEYGKDIWMKFQLPTQHYLYFGVQVKKEKLDASARGGDANIAAVLAQVEMALAHPVWDPETNLTSLVDHVIIVSAGEITKQAKNLLGGKLDAGKRRHILFLDRDDLLNLAAGMNLQLAGRSATGDEIPF